MRGLFFSVIVSMIVLFGSCCRDCDITPSAGDTTFFTNATNSVEIFRNDSFPNDSMIFHFGASRWQPDDKVCPANGGDRCAAWITQPVSINAINGQNWPNGTVEVRIDEDEWYQASLNVFNQQLIQTERGGGVTVGTVGTSIWLAEYTNMGGTHTEVYHCTFTSSNLGTNDCSYMYYSLDEGLLGFGFVNGQSYHRR